LYNIHNVLECELMQSEMEEVLNGIAPDLNAHWAKHRSLHTYVYPQLRIVLHFSMAGAVLTAGAWALSSAYVGAAVSPACGG
jgi:hypothetical protein